jgi:hypothetical protein
VHSLKTDAVEQVFKGYAVHDGRQHAHLIRFNLTQTNFGSQVAAEEIAAADDDGQFVSPLLEFLERRTQGCEVGG